MFFAMFGAIFLLTQYLQFVLGYSPFETGVRLLPVAVAMMIVSPLERAARASGSAPSWSSAPACCWSPSASCRSRPLASRQRVLARHHAGGMMLMAIGMALTMAPATESIMGSLPLGQGGRGFGGQRHHPPGRRRAGRRGDRQRAGVDLRVAGGRLPAGQAGPERHQQGAPAVARARARGGQGGAGPRRRRHRRVHGRHARRRAGRGRSRAGRSRHRVRLAARARQLRRARGAPLPAEMPAVEADSVPTRT